MANEGMEDWSVERVEEFVGEEFSSEISQKSTGKLLCKAVNNYSIHM